MNNAIRYLGTLIEVCVGLPIVLVLVWAMCLIIYSITVTIVTILGIIAVLGSSAGLVILYREWRNNND